MGNITVRRYSADADAAGWQGWMQPDDASWIAFIDKEGLPHIFLDLCSECGGVLTENHPEGMAGFCYHRNPETGELI